MGKSPGKWVKAILFGKKSSKSGFARDVALDKGASIITKASVAEFVSDPSAVRDTPWQSTDEEGQKAEFGRDTTADLSSAKQGSGKRGVLESNLADGEITSHEKAVIKAQAPFRGYWVRGAFWELKGITRLQALVRGHLVRRQAVATLNCIQAVVKLQALVRCQGVSFSIAGQKMQSITSLGETKDTKNVNSYRVHAFPSLSKLSANAFVRKLFSLLPNAVPLSLQYDPYEPNSAWIWLERWSSARLWEPLVPLESVVGTKPQKKLAIRQAVEHKRVNQEATTENSCNHSPHSSELEKFKQDMRKILSHQEDSPRAEPLSELERVKQNLRRISASNAAASDKSETATKQSEEAAKEVSSWPRPNASEQRVDDSTDKVSKPMASLCTPVDMEASAKSLDETCGMLSIVHPPDEDVSLKSRERNESSLLLDESGIGEDQTSEENPRTRRNSFSSKKEIPGNFSRKASLPSYMAATESAKAKLRVHGNLSTSEGGAENDFNWRHALPFSTTGKSDSSSPSIEKQVQSNGNAGSKRNRSLPSSRDDKLLQPDWRR